MTKKQIQKQIIGALIGLVGAVNNNGKTENTDVLIRSALLSDDADDMIRRIHHEKYTISPNCETCQSPCGNTSDYDAARFDQSPENILRLKEEIMEALAALAGQETLPEIVYQAIAYLGYDMTEETYTELLKELRA